MDNILKERKRIKVILISLFVLLIFSFVGTLFIGRYPINPMELMRQSDEVNRTGKLVIMGIRLPRIIATLLVGSALAVSGATFQALFDNPMASPNLLGVNQGASLGAVLAILFAMPKQIVVLWAFFGGLLTVLLSYLLSRTFRMQHSIGLILSGMVISSFMSAGVSMIKLVADEQNVLPAITYWLLGSFSKIHWNDVKSILLSIAIGYGLILSQAETLNLLTLGEDKAESLGVSLKRAKASLIIGSTLLTASAVSITGVIGWIGLIIPHMTRQLIGSNYRHLLLGSILTGAIFTVWVDTIGRSINQTEIPIGILTALIGGPIFICLLLRGGAFRDFNR